MKKKGKNKSQPSIIQKEDDNDDEKIPIQKVHIYNNNRHLQKSSSAGNIRLFFEPYYSELKNSTNNNLFNSRPKKKSILEIEYVNFPKIDDNLLESRRPERYLQKGNVFANNNIRGYNNYNINDYNNSFGKNDYYRYNNVNINRLPKIHNNYNYNNFGYNNKYNQGYDYNNYIYDENNYYRRRELGELYSRMFLSRDNINDMNYKIRNYYIKSIDQPSNNDSTFNYNRLRNNPRNYTFKTFKKDDIIINDIKASRKYREFVFFQNLKKYIEPQQSIIDEDKKSKVSEESEKSEKSKKSKETEKREKESKKKEMIKQFTNGLVEEDKESKKESKKSESNKESKKSESKKEDKKSEESSDDEEEEEEESDSEDKNKKEKKKEETKEKQENKNTEQKEKKEETINKKETIKKEEEKEEKKEEKKKEENKNNKDKKESEEESEEESDDEEEEEEESDEEEEKKK